ncbi:cation acetate symporter [Armatimonas sp.]|uniref:sodium/solute symporter n=1 Tax=Armatimonas sp. TaxID=1872638 RepID=UPI00286D03BC|nr:cation acetate symporter [Armatimonas sp.]
MIPLFFVILVTIATVILGVVATKRAQSASDFFVAGRQVSVGMNASAISGEYLSAASFMGVAGLILKNGYDALWYPVGYAAGYLLLLLFIAGPLRRFGAYTIPDFAEGRFDSPLFRKIAVSFVLFIGFFYTMPQMKGAGVAMQTIMGWPYWVGIVVVGSVITFNVALGGMKGITFVQAFQYWVKLFAISVPVFVLMAVYGGYSGKLGTFTGEPKGIPKVTKDTPLKFVGKDKAPNNAVSFSPGAETVITFTKDTEIDKISTGRKPEPGEDKLDASLAILPKIEGVIPAGTQVTILPLVVTKAGQAVLSKEGKPIKTAPKLEFAKPTEAVLAAGSFVPNTQNNAKWGLPYGTLTSKHGFPVLYTYSLIIALICGTAGLPHILVRFYTNPDGKSAKATTFWVMVLIGAFYAFTPIWGALGRADLPMLYANNKTDSVVIALPRAIGGVWGDVLSGVTSAGAFAAFMSTFSGLLVSMSGALAHDIYGKIIKPSATPEERIKMFKIAAVIFGFASMALGLLVETFDIAMLVGWAFAIAAASYFPLLLLGAWWRGLTMPGAAAGMLGGGLLSLGAIIAFMLSDKKIITIDDPLTKALCEQPAVWGVPLALVIMFVVSKVTAKQIPWDADLKMLRLHAPEALGRSKDYIEDTGSDH